MTTGYKPPKAGASVTFFSTAVQQSQKNISQGAQKHHELLVKAGANRGGKRKKRRRKRFRRTYKGENFRKRVTAMNADRLHPEKSGGRRRRRKSRKKRKKTRRKK